MTQLATEQAQGVAADGAADRAGRIGETILDLQNISLSFGGVKALTDISFDVREHEIRAIIGPNGAGKSSMLNVINGVYTPQEGDEDRLQEVVRRPQRDEDEGEQQQAGDEPAVLADWKDLLIRPVGALELAVFTIEHGRGFLSGRQTRSMIFSPNRPWGRNSRNTRDST